MKILEHYSVAVNARNLKSDPRTTMSSTDVLAAMGLASRDVPLGAAITRMLSGGGTGQVIDILADMAWRRARHHNVRMCETHARDVATAVLGWYRGGTCQPCGGRGYLTMKDAPVQGDQCPHCTGTGKIPFNDHFSGKTLPIAQWLSTKIEQEQASAGVAAMAKIANMF